MGIRISERLLKFFIAIRISERFWKLFVGIRISERLLEFFLWGSEFLYSCLGFFFWGGGIRNYESYNKKVLKELCRKSSLFDGI